MAGTGHQLLSALVELPDAGVVLTGRLSVAAQPWLADHVVGGVIVVPGTAVLEMVIQAGDRVGCGEVERLTLEVPLVVPPEGGVAVQLMVGAAGEAGGRELTLRSRSEDTGLTGPWVRHASGRLVRAAAAGVVSEALVVWPPVALRWCRWRVFTRGWPGRGWSTGRCSRVCGRCGGARVRCSLRSNCPRTAAMMSPGSGCTRRCWMRGCTRSRSVMWCRRKVRHCRSSGLMCRCAPPGADRLRVRLVVTGPDTVRVQAFDHEGVPVFAAGSLTVRRRPGRWQ